MSVLRWRRVTLGVRGSPWVVLGTSGGLGHLGWSWAPRVVLGTSGGLGHLGWSGVILGACHMAFEYESVERWDEICPGKLKHRPHRSGLCLALSGLTIIFHAHPGRRDPGGPLALGLYVTPRWG